MRKYYEYIKKLEEKRNCFFPGESFPEKGFTDIQRQALLNPDNDEKVADILSNINIPGVPFSLKTKIIYFCWWIEDFGLAENKHELCVERRMTKAGQDALYLRSVSDAVIYFCMKNGKSADDYERIVTASDTHMASDKGIGRATSKGKTVTYGELREFHKEYEKSRHTAPLSAIIKEITEEDELIACIAEHDPEFAEIRETARHYVVEFLLGHNALSPCSYQSDSTLLSIDEIFNFLLDVNTYFFGHLGFTKHQSLLREIFLWAEEQPETISRENYPQDIEKKIQRVLKSEKLEDPNCISSSKAIVDFVRDGIDSSLYNLAKAMYKHIILGEADITRFTFLCFAAYLNSLDDSGMYSVENMNCILFACGWPSLNKSVRDEDSLFIDMLENPNDEEFRKSLVFTEFRQYDESDDFAVARKDYEISLAEAKNRKEKVLRN